MTYIEYSDACSIRLVLKQYALHNDFTAGSHEVVHDRLLCPQKFIFSDYRRHPQPLLLMRCEIRYQTSKSFSNLLRTCKFAFSCALSIHCSSLLVMAPSDQLELIFIKKKK